MLNDDKYNVEKQRKRAGEAQVMVAEGSSFKIGRAFQGEGAANADSL